MTSLDFEHQPDEFLLGFARALRAAGVPVTVDRSRAWLEAVALLGVSDRLTTYWAGRATLCTCPSDLARYDQVFDVWFRVGEGPQDSEQPVMFDEPVPSLLPDEDGCAAADPDAEPIAGRASATEVLRHRDVGELNESQRAELAAQMATLQPVAPRRLTHRRITWRRGEVDAHRTLRTMLRRMGEPGPVEWRRRGTRPRRVILLVDVSGSMSSYADALLRLSHRIMTASRGGDVEVFTLGTRLTRLTRELRIHDPEAALVAAGQAVPDWAGGTRLGDDIKAFLDHWGQRGMARGAVVVVFSDGWETGDLTLLAMQIARLHRLTHRLVWVNPHRGKVGYAPVQGGVRAVLPHVDDFVAGHSLATFSDLVELLARA